MRTTIACLLLLAGAGPTVATQPEVLPPAILQPESFPPISYYRKSAYDVWQNLAVDNQGFFRARVILTPYGAFYRYNGQPFPYVTTQQRRFMPYASD
jgi:hypothetical protein